MDQRTGSASVLWSSCLAMFAVGANSTAIMAALPDMRIELSLSSAGVEWAVNAYLVVSAACIVLGGQAADRYGARLASIAGLVLFGLASCIIALAGSQTELLAGRALQGLAAAFAVPSTLAAVDASAAPERRAAAIGAWTGFLMLGFSIGPLLGGALTHFTSWRAIFWLNLLLMSVAIAGMASAGLAGAHGATRKRRADWIGFVLLAVLMVSLVFGLHALPHAGTAPLSVVVPFALAAIALVLMLNVESRHEAPLVDLGFFTRRGFVMGVAIGSLAMFSIISLLLYFNLYAQSPDGLGFTALEAGAALLPLSAALLALALSASAVAKRVGLRNAMTGGMALIAIASAMIGLTVAGHGGMILLAAGFLAMGAGLAVPYALAPRLALSALSPAQVGQGSGIVNACTFLGGSAGVAGGATALALGGFPAVLTMIALAGIAGVVLSRWIAETPPG
ncbi:MAG: MFS transporter [Xanthobacteraceae bacterium]